MILSDSIPKMSDRQLEILRFVCSKSPLGLPFPSRLTIKKISAHLGIPKSTVHEQLIVLRELRCTVSNHIAQSLIEATALGHEVVRIADSAGSQQKRD